MIYSYITRRRSHTRFTSCAMDDSAVTYYDETEAEFVDRVVDEATEQGDDLVAVQYFTDHRNDIDRAVVTMKVPNNT